jgi:hypothetical protein
VIISINHFNVGCSKKKMVKKALYKEGFFVENIVFKGVGDTGIEPVTSGM